MNNSDYSDLDAEIINITPRRGSPRGWRKWIILPALFVIAIVLLRGIGIYVESLWFDSLGFASRFWYEFRLGWTLFAVFGILTIAVLRGRC
jgi:uncharacterized membrane protein (UPF0182 family)